MPFATGCETISLPSRGRPESRATDARGREKRRLPMKTYSGSCHCGAVRFEADLDLGTGTKKCNCSICWKGRAWFAFAKGADRFRLLAGRDVLSEYRWTPPGRPQAFLTFSFCR